MEAITFDNLAITGIQYNKICSLWISQKVNDHARAEFTCQMNLDKGEDFVNRADGKTVIKITTSAKGQPKVLFAGCLASAGIDKTGGYALVKVKLVSTTHLLDLKPENKSFQNTSLTYENVMNQVLSGRGSVDVTVTDKPIGNFIMQYQETAWEFIKRMASGLGASLFPDVTSSKPFIRVGVPSSGAEKELTLVDINGGSRLQMSSGSKPICALEYCYLGEKIRVNGASYTVGAVESVMTGAMLISSFQTNKKEDFIQAPIYNHKSSGKMFLGTVKAVQGDKVQVHLNEIDSSYDAGGNHWFPYSTIYASSDGSGFYCMPEVGDMVRVFMPSNNEKDAFASGSVNTNPQENPRDKSWKAPGGHEILLTDEGIYIICEKEKIFINLTKKDGIEIKSDKKIEISSDEGIIVESYKNITLSAKNQINMSVGNSSVLVDKEQIRMTANNVYVN